MITMEGIYSILKPFGGDNTLVFAISATRSDRNCDRRGSNRRMKHRGRIWVILKYRSNMSGTRGRRRHIIDRLLQMKVRLVGLIRGMNLVFTLNKPAFILPFIGSETFIMKYSTRHRFKWYLVSE